MFSAKPSGFFLDNYDWMIQQFDFYFLEEMFPMSVNGGLFLSAEAISLFFLLIAGVSNPAKIQKIGK